jgi:hypothetical protein
MRLCLKSGIYLGPSEFTLSGYPVLTTADANGGKAVPDLEYTTFLTICWTHRLQDEKL